MTKMSERLTRHRRSAVAAPALATAFAAALAGPAGAEPAVLSTLDGSFSVAGDLVGYDGTNFTIRTAVGEITVQAALVTCDGAGCPAPPAEMTPVTVAGERTLALRLMPALLRAHAERTGATVATAGGGETMVLTATGGEDRKDIELTIAPSTTSAGFEALFRGAAHLALATRPARAREVRAFDEFGLGELRDATQETVVGLDGLILVNHPENPVRQITMEEAGRVFSGEITNWAELGGNDAPIRLHLRGDDPSREEVFTQMLLRPLGAEVSPEVARAGSDEAIVRAVTADVDALGITGFVGRGHAQALSVGGNCGLMTPPTEFSIKTEEYPLTRMLYMYETSKPFPEGAQAFRDFMETEAAQRMVVSAGYIDQSVTLETINAQGLRVATAVLSNAREGELPLLRDMLGELVRSDRLSTTFRFETASSRLNARSEADVRRLAEVLATDRFASKEVLFVGFTDSVGDAELNRQLSQQRASQVLAAVLQANPALASTVRMNALGYGEISPLGCDETTEGRLVNRRVEVWVRDVPAGEG